MVRTTLSELAARLTTTGTCSRCIFKKDRELWGCRDRQLRQASQTREWDQVQQLLLELLVGSMPINRSRTLTVECTTEAALVGVQVLLIKLHTLTNTLCPQPTPTRSGNLELVVFPQHTRFQIGISPKPTLEAWRRYKPRRRWDHSQQRRTSWGRARSCRVWQRLHSRKQSRIRTPDPSCPRAWRTRIKRGCMKRR